MLKIKNKLALGLLGCWLAIMPIYNGLSFADAVSEKKEELAQVKQKMAEMEKRKAAARREAEAASDELEEVMVELRGLQRESNALQRRSNVLQGKINENQAKLAEKQKQMTQRTGIYKKRLRDIYINGQINYLDVLLGAKDFSDFSSRMYLLQKIVKNDLNLLDALKKDAQEIENRTAELNGQLSELKAARAQLEAKKARVNQVREKRANMLYKKEEAKHRAEEEYDRLAAISENITVMLRNMESGGKTGGQSAGGTGRFVWPCRGEITSYFGWRTHPIFGTTKYHSGMDIAVDYGTPIVAADNGNVIYSGWLGGYGNCVMIDHGGGLVTLYGHNSSLTVSEGQHVNKGQLVAYAGSTGYSTGPHCHFEARLHGEVTEPLNYLP